MTNKYKIAHESDEYITSEIMKYDSIYYEKIKAKDAKVGYKND